MAEADAQGMDAREPLALDPFDYFAGVASKIGGLGGDEQRPEINYGFHTHYVRCAPGHCYFKIAIDGLTATTGTLHLQINAISDAPGSHAKIATLARISLAEWAFDGESREVRFESLRGHTYAVYGMIMGPTDAVAEALHVLLDRPFLEREDTGEAQTPVTEFGSSSASTVERLTSDDIATLRAPVSQLCTVRQMRDAKYRDAEPSTSEAAFSEIRWERAYATSVLQSYGLVQPDARGLGLGPRAGEIESALSSLGCRVTLATFDNAVNHPKFDFLWSLGVTESFENSLLAGKFIIESLHRLKIGGMGVYTFAFTRDIDNGWTTSGEAYRHFSKNDVERMALKLVSQEHQVAQLKFELGNRALRSSLAELPITSFGLIVRRGAGTI